MISIRWRQYAIRIMLRVVVFVVVGGLVLHDVVDAGLTVGTVAHVKGQETNTLHGFGIVVGLKGTGDKPKSFQETGRSLARMLELCGHSTVRMEDMFASKNVALVSVTVTVPASGAREGELLDCIVASIGAATSLEGGQLLLTSLLGPIPSQDPQNAIVYAQAQGPIVLEKGKIPTRGRISRGAQLRQDFFNPYIQDGLVTLVIDDRFATYGMADAVAFAIDQELPDGKKSAQAINQNNVVVKLPAYATADPVKFIADILSRELYGVDRVPTVIINRDAESLAIDEDVEIRPTTVSHGNMVITLTAQANPVTKPERFASVDPAAKASGIENPKLKALQESLNEVNVPAKDIITIIEMLDKQGNIYGRVEYH